MAVRNKKYWEFICKEAEILGIINADDSVESVMHKYEDGFKYNKTHADYFPNKLKRWRWNFKNGLDNLFSDFDIGDSDLVKQHITREYGIPFWENGYHDLNFLLKKINYKPRLSSDKQQTRIFLERK